MSEVYVSPGGARMEVASAAKAIRMRARGWKPEAESVPEPAAPPASAPVRARKPAESSESIES